ncbi:MAG: hypothetical protein QG597_2361, partial [Actinomycetota bacterium]|nr:hypothetical protein [Actinomycetota bacterium]
MIDRDRLTRDILATPAGAMCLLQAPRGYGVTTALTRAMAAAEGPVRWVDASGLTQVGSLTAAVGAWADEKWLVIDGVGDPSLVGADLADLAGVIPDDARVAVGGTVPLGMLVLDQPWSNLLDRGTLAFTDDEAMALLMALAPAVDPAELSLVSRWCEGWAAALVLAASRLRRGAQDTEEWLRATGPEVLVGRWFEAQPDHVRRFLLDTALLDDLLVGPCDAVREATDSGHILAGFDTAEGPVARAGAGAGGHPRWRRHRLLTELLRARTPVTQSHRWAHRQAAAWFVAHSDVSQAIHHLIEAGEHRDAGTLLRDHEGDLLSSGAIATTLDWYSRMPATAWDAAAEHELRLGWGRLLVGDVSGARDNLARVNLVVGVSVDSLPGESSGGVDLPREAALLRACIAAAQGDTAEMIVAADQATEGFAGDTAENAGQLAPVALARGLLWQGEVPRAHRVVSGIEQLRYPNAILREVALRGVQAACAVAEGSVGVAESIVERGLTWLSERGRDALDLRQYTF